MSDFCEAATAAKNKMKNENANVLLSNLFVVCNSKSKQINSSEYLDSGSYPVIDQSSKYIAGWTDEKENLYSGDLPVTIFGDHTRHVKFIDFDFVCGADGTQLLKSKKGISDEYLYYLVCRASEKIGNYGYDRHFKHLKEAVVEFFYTDIKLQHKIAKILTTVDNLIEQTQALIDKYTAIKQGMMADLFTRGIDLSGTPETNPNHGQLRPSFEEAPELYKETELGWVPRDWDVTRLKSYLKNIEQGWSPDCESEPAIEGEWGVLKTTAVVWEGFSAEQNKALPKHLIPRPAYEVQRDDVLMTRAGPGNRVGVVAFVDKTQDKLMLSDKLYRIVPSAGLTSQYLALLLSSHSTQRQLNATKTGLAESQSNISQAIVSKLIVHIPSEVEQTWIVTKLSGVTNKISSELTLLKKLELQKKGLMQDLLTGKVQVTA